MPTNQYERVPPGSYDASRHFYPRVLNAQMHALVRFFLSLDHDRIIHRYCYLNPRVDPGALGDLLAYVPQYFRWSGCDLFHATSAAGRRRMVVIETNSCPSGQKSMPLFEEHDDYGGYRTLLESSFLPRLKGRRLPPGDLAVIYDKNFMEASGYAATLADLTSEPVHLVSFYDSEQESRVRFDNGHLHVRTSDDVWVPIRAAFRYVTQRPWSRIPIHTKTAIFNPTFACVAGGRNKMLAAKAYDIFNAKIQSSGLKIQTPETVWDISHDEVPMWVGKMGGIAVVKNPYSNAGQGVWTLTSQAELDAFMELPQSYDRFIVQSLIGHHAWSSNTSEGRYFQVGTMPTKRKAAYVFDLRVMTCANKSGFQPLAIYGRRARNPLNGQLGDAKSWDILGTNLSEKNDDGSWGSDTARLLLMDRRDFNSLGIGLDDLIEGFIQTTLATIAIDEMAKSLTSKKGTFRAKLFGSLNDDPALREEIVL